MAKQAAVRMTKVNCSNIGKRLIGDWKKGGSILPNKKQGGVALITALLIVSLATIMAVSLVSGQYMDVRRTGNIMSSDKAYLQALTMETSASYLLKFSRNTASNSFDNMKDFEEAVQGLNVSAMQVSEGEAGVSLELVYPEAKFNVNTLLDSAGLLRPKQKKRFENLVKLVLEDIQQPVSMRDGLVDSLIDWIDEDQNDRPNGAEDSTYESKEPPYKAANRLIASISELKLIEGFNKDILYGIPKDPNDPNSEAIPGIMHYVSALPDIDSVINVNLVTDPKIIQSLSIHINDKIAENILAEQPFEKIEDFLDSTAWDDIKVPSAAGGGVDWIDLKAKLTEAKSSSRIEVQSSYFVAKSTATLGNSIFILNSLVYVDTAGTKVEIESRAVGTNGI